MRARKSREEWAAIIRAFEQSGATQQAFCARRGLKVGTFRWWRSTLRGTADVPELLPVQVRSAGTSGEPPVAEKDVVVGVGDVELRVAVGTDVRYVAALVAELQRC